MNRKDLRIVVSVALIAGLIGGAVSAILLHAGAVTAQEAPKLHKVIKAEKFVVMSKDGEGYGTLEADQDGVSLYLSYEGGGADTQVVLFATNGGATLIMNNGPFDVKSRTAPIVLKLRPNGEAFLSLKGERGEKQVFLTTGVDGSPSIKLADVKGNGRAVLGSTSLDRPRTGVVEIRPPSSLVLFNEKGNVLWKAP